MGYMFYVEVPFYVRSVYNNQHRLCIPVKDLHITEGM
jgi:hypothetical protein